MALKPSASRGAWFRRPDDAGLQDRLVLDKQLAPHERTALGHWHWEIWARDEQLPPQGPWRVWLICAGRGFGKTRAGAEWVRDVARQDPTARIALVGASLGEVRSVMVEGESGVLAASPGALAPEFEPSLKRLIWPNCAQAFLYSAGEPESLRGPQHSHARRPGAEGTDRQRRRRQDRHPSPSSDRRHGRRAACSSCRGPNLACRQRQRCLGEPLKRACRLCRRTVAIHETSCRFKGLRPGRRSHPLLQRTGLANRRPARRSKRRSNRRCRSSRRRCRNLWYSCNTRIDSAKLRGTDAHARH